ncbi:MAG TPA: DUF4214 domain-containing protein [Noviherbaspirillum sp.]|nr:DUF4214 domain-containing protein [Noviherbaspirillum sp.]
MKNVTVALLLVTLVLAGCGGGSQDSVGRSAMTPSAITAPHTHVVADYHSIVQQLYIAYFGRPADPGGLANFAAELESAHASSDIQALNAAYGSNPRVRSLVDTFGSSEESKSLYPGDTNAFVTAIYRNVLNREPDAEGLDFWMKAIDERGLTRAHASFSIMAGALANSTVQGRSDAMLINRRVSVGTAFTASLSTPALVSAYRGDASAALARDMLRSVTGTSDDRAVRAAIGSTLATLSSAPPSGGGTSGGGQLPVEDFSAAIAVAPADGAAISGVVRLEVRGTGLVNVELLPSSGYEPLYARFSVSEGRLATLDLDSRRLPDGPIAVRVAAFNVAAGGSGREITAMPTRTWHVSNSLPSSVPSVPVSTPLVMQCPDGAGHCSGGSTIRVDNGIALMSSGVNVYGRSTSDLLRPNPTVSTASGLQPASGGTVEVRVGKDSAGSVYLMALLLSNLGLSWDGRVERPPIIETFRNSPSVVRLNSAGALTFSALPDSSNLGFYDYAVLGRFATQANYANNAYFPRTGNPSRCPADIVPCPATEATGLMNQSGDWRRGGAVPDWASAGRLHGDGDVFAGNGVPGPGGIPTLLPGSTGFGVPFPGSMGYRLASNWGYQYANLAAWESLDTVLIDEWAGLANQHATGRRGLVAFGDVTSPQAIPATGTTTYTGITYGWYTPSPAQNPILFRGAATITINLATRAVSIRLSETFSYDASMIPIQLPSLVSATAGSPGSNVANYFTGSVNAEGFTGGIGGRYFGPIAGSGSSLTPLEIGGVLSFTNPFSGAVVLGGFLGRKL